MMQTLYELLKFLILRKKPFGQVKPADRSTYNESVIRKGYCESTLIIIVIDKAYKSNDDSEQSC